MNPLETDIVLLVPCGSSNLISLIITLANTENLFSAIDSIA